MLQLTDIRKNYSEGENQVRALQGISLQFRRSEFVSILGPSGCGKTTMLNIIGGLDQYTAGDLIIDGTSTKDFTDRQWDAYRNHSVGFVFQSYNLIPHQSVLANVELALSLSGVGRKERRERAKKALEQVGLGDQLRKKPGEMSGGQMQRVAIARALVNDPDIILADEPTGALDTQTSVQVMEILKEISKERLVIMVTHNPELAEKYSTRIIKMLDGLITDDSRPLTEQEIRQEQPKKKAGKMPSMSLLTSFSLSLKNLFTKKGRTILTSFAGSIGIIGIALIYAVSQGATTYIQHVQEETLTSYPLTLQSTTVNLGTLMSTFMGATNEEDRQHELDGVYSQSVLFDMVNALNNLESTKNDLKSFKFKLDAELKNPESTLSQALSGVQYTYDFDLLIYTKAVDGKVVISDTQKLLMDAIDRNLEMNMSSMMDMQDQMYGSMGMSSMMGGANIWSEILSGKDGSLISPLVKEQYTVVEGRWPAAYNEVVLVVNERYEISDLTLYALGLKSQEEIDKVFEAVNNGTQLESGLQKWSFEEILAMDFRAVPNARCYVYDEATGMYADLRDTDTGLLYLYDNGVNLKVTGIIAPNPDTSSHMISGSIAYTKALTEYVIDQAQDSPVIKAQMDDPEWDIFTGLPFPHTGTMTAEDKEAYFRDHMAQLDEKGKAELFLAVMSLPSQEELDLKVSQALENATRESMEQTLIQMMSQQVSVSVEQLQEYISKMSQEEIEGLYSQMIVMQLYAQKAYMVQQQYAAVPAEQLAALLEQQEFTVEQCARFYDEVLEFSDSTYEQNLTDLGYVHLDDPATVNLYASSFDNKKVIEDFIASYNASVEELKQIRYTDYVGIMMSSITTIINAITYVLIAFVAISLVVSSIMIGVITLISVQERTKEIGILRAIGASKRNVSSMFNAETVIIGFASGVLGVCATWLLCIPINAIIGHLTGIANLKAYLPVNVAVILVIISMLLTLVSGIIPSASAAKKDPVVALRTE